MSEPSEAGWQKLKRLGRYLRGVPRLIQRLERQNPPNCVLALSDSDHAGCLRTRRSTTCNILLHGNHIFKIVCYTKTPVAFSSGESEWYALTHDACAVIGLKNLSRDLGRHLAAHLTGDASAASGIGARRGVGKMRHFETRTLWLQKHITEKETILQRTNGSEHPSTSFRRRCGNTSLHWVLNHATANPS